MPELGEGTEFGDGMFELGDECEELGDAVESGDKDTGDNEVGERVGETDALPSHICEGT
jgi:hypothetical protein